MDTWPAPHNYAGRQNSARYDRITLHRHLIAFSDSVRIRLPVYPTRVMDVVAAVIDRQGDAKI